MKKMKSRPSSVLISKKIYFALFLLLIACAFVIGMLNYYDKTKFSYDSTVRYYYGDEYSFEPLLLFHPEEIEDYEENKIQAFLRSN